MVVVVVVTVVVVMVVLVEPANIHYRYDVRNNSLEARLINVFLLLLIENLRRMSCAIVIFDLSFGDHYTFAFAEVLNVPLLSFKPVIQDLSNEFFYSALPSYETYARAIVDLLKFCIGKENTPREKVAILFEGSSKR